jgi:hypothetical protein
LRVYTYHAIGMLACVALQNSWPTWLAIHGQAPDLALVLTLATGLARGPQEGFISGFIGALLIGSGQGLPFAPLFIKFMSVGFVAGLLRGRLVSDRAMVAALLSLVAIVVVRLITLVLVPPPSPWAWLRETLAQAPYSALMAAPLFALVNTLNRQYPLRIDQ